MAGLIAAVPPSALAANLVVNGSFESPQPCSPFAQICDQYQSGSTAISGWTVGGANVEHIPASFWEAEDGNASIDLSGSAPGSLTQTVATSPGQTYTLSWFISGNPDGGQKVKTMKVSWNGAVVAQPTFDTTLTSRKAMGWRLEKVKVLASGSSTPLTFADATSDQSQFGAALDDVQLTTGTLRLTATQVVCNYHYASGSDTCTATVSDSDAPPLITPSGQVNFNSRIGGIFPAGATCKLSPTPLSPGVASCSVEFLPPATQYVIPPGGVGAAYGGDDEHLASSGETKLFAVGGGSSGSDGTNTVTDCGGSTAARSQVHAARTSIVMKGCAVLGATAGGVITYGGVTLLMVPEPTTLTKIAGWALAAGGLVVLKNQLDTVSDPPDSLDRELALPPAPPVSLRLGRRCPGGRGRTCVRLRRAVIRYIRALNEAARTAGALASTGNRLMSARRTGDEGATALQIAAAKAYSGALAQAYASLQRRGASLARVARRAGLSLRASRGRLERVARRLGRHPPRVVLHAWRTAGGSHASLSRELRLALRKAMRGRRSLSLVMALRQRLPAAGFERNYRAMRLENLRALVRGLARGGLVSASGGASLLRHLACTADHPRPAIDQFRRDAETIAPPAYGALLRFAAVPLLKLTSCG